MNLNLTINGKALRTDIMAGETLLEVLRRLGYVGVKSGCGTGDCGACAILLNGRAVNSCLVLAACAEGASITTVEGLEEGLHAGMHQLDSLHQGLAPSLGVQTRHLADRVQGR